MNRLLINGSGDSAGHLPALTSTSSPFNGASNMCENPNDVRRLQDEVNQLTKRNGG